MIDENAQNRLGLFFEELKSSLFPFDQCEHVDQNTRAFQGETPLKVAVVRQDARLVADLLDAGADPNLPGEDACTPLHHAAGRPDIEIVRLLLSRGASPSLRNDYGRTPIDYATEQARQVFARYA